MRLVHHHHAKRPIPPQALSEAQPTNGVVVKSNHRMVVCRLSPPSFSVLLPQ
ncbi:hypothetical protein BKA80DRAFT_279705 [Phyllosticta citrichinensis]